MFKSIKCDFNSVEAIGNGAFKNCTSLTQAILPATLQSTDHNLFSFSSNLSDVQILADDALVYYSILDGTAYYDNPDNWVNGGLYVGKYLITVEDNSFNTTYTVKDGTTSIASFAFKYVPNKKITKIILPESLKVIGESVFEDMTNLVDINMPSSVDYIGADAFYSTGIISDTSPYWVDNGLYLNHFLIAVKSVNMKTFTVKEGTRRIIDGQLFNGDAVNVTQIILPDSLECIGSQNFSSTQITSIVLPANLKYIGYRAFYMCKQLTTVDTSRCVDLQCIGEGAFMDCSSLTSIDISELNNLSQISYGAFIRCGLTEIYIPISVEYMGEWVFHGIKQITVNCATSSKPAGWDDAWTYNSVGTITVNWGVSL